ncbi:5'/3'-nucleotidase SurE [Sphingomonas sp. BIUV-7]|uniref:5'-nucleotidase SurE n=1 Tax=Sphingomonas natans TaxID=3063330 RepID=A0ABT8YBJ2_9SPHN|nr:5'/3'-nucleotidase SurE [Sphingomonas sp. BIUV-7]MDO6415716.1 5'/3'-nucleotidase SurE [Sphingomonas sp. BIUV-7]
MRILVTNDDGLGANGILLLERIALSFTSDVTVVAPAEEQSGKGRSLTITAPLRMRSYDARHHAVVGTPTDAVIMALGEVMKDSPPDLVLSGINRGANLAEDVSYSGTVAAAQEAALAGIPAIALSQIYPRRGMGDSVTFEAAEGWCAKVLEKLIGMDWAPRTLINVNFPPAPSDEVRGIKVVRQGLRDWSSPKLEHGVDPRGYPYWWMHHGSVPKTVDADTDLEASAQNYVTVTPLHLDMTHDPSKAALEARFG